MVTVRTRKLGTCRLGKPHLFIYLFIYLLIDWLIDCSITVIIIIIRIVIINAIPFYSVYLFSFCLFLLHSSTYSCPVTPVVSESKDSYICKVYYLTT